VVDDRSQPVNLFALARHDVRRQTGEVAGRGFSNSKPFDLRRRFDQQLTAETLANVRRHLPYVVPESVEYVAHAPRPFIGSLQSAVDDLEKTMSESGKYYSVEITKRPLDIESDNRLSGNVGAGNAGQQLRAELGFRVVRELEL